MQRALSYSEPRILLERRQTGVSLIEVMVGMVIALMAMLVMVQMFSASESARRGTTGASDSVQSAALASHYLNIGLQSAGAGLVRGHNVWGCKVLLTSGGVDVLPRATAFPAPFSAVPQTVRLAPVAVFSGGAGVSDVVMVASGNGESANRDFPFDVASGGALVFTNPAAFKPDDFLLAIQREVGLGAADCRVVRIDSTYDPGGAETYTRLGATAQALKSAAKSVTLSSTYGGVDSAIATSSPSAQNMGSAPSLALYGVNDRSELVKWNLIDGTTTILAENVFLFKVLLGIDNDVSRSDPSKVGAYDIEAWTNATGDWAGATLLNGTATSAENLDRILALRVGLVVRSAQPGAASRSSVVLFDGVSGAKNPITSVAANLSETVNLTGVDARYAYTVTESVVPVRNARSAYRGG